MDFYKVPIGFGMALAQNTAAMNRYAHLDEAQKQVNKILKDNNMINEYNNPFPLLSKRLFNSFSVNS